MEVDITQYDASGILEQDKLVPSTLYKAANEGLLYQRQRRKSD